MVLAAPGLIPRKPADRVKTDRRDAHSLAMALRAGQLTGIYIPTEQDESVRDYLRMYEALRGDLRICKQRILQFLLRRSIRYQGGGPWTVKHRHWLSTLEFGQPRDRQTLDMYLSQMQELEAKCSEAAAEVESIAAQDCYGQQTKKLTAFKGIKTLIALSFITDIGDFRRFASARQFMAYLGLVPSEHSSGNKRRQGGITKAGNSHLRRLLVEAAWHYRSYHPGSRDLTERRRGVDSAVTELCQPRRTPTESEVHAHAAARQEISGGRHRRQPRAGRLSLGRDDRPRGLKCNCWAPQVEGGTEEVFLDSQNPRTKLSAVSSLTEPSQEREASCRRPIGLRYPIRVYQSGQSSQSPFSVSSTT